MNESKLTYKGKIYQLYEAFPNKMGAIALAEQIGSEPGKKVVVKDLGQTRLKWGVYIYEKHTQTYVPIIRGNPKRKKNPHFKIGSSVWVKAYKSTPGKGLSYPRMVGIMLEDAPAGTWDVVDIRDEEGKVWSVYSFSLVRPSYKKKNPTLAVFNPPHKKWYWGAMKTKEPCATVFSSQKTPTRKSHGLKYTFVTGPFTTKQKAVDKAQWTGYRKIYFSNPPEDVLSNEVLEMAYVHAEDGKAYKHDFEKSGTRAVLNKDGSVSLKNKKHKLWRDF